MGTFGGTPWGGGGAGGTVAPGTVAVRPLLYMALRLAHVTHFADATANAPSPDQIADAILLGQLMISQAQLKRAMIFSISIAQYPLTAAKEIYTIGPNGDFNAPRPVKIEASNIILPNGTPVYVPVFQGSFREFSQLSVQQIPGAIPKFLYCDYDTPLSNIYVVPQDQGGDSLELYTWQAVPTIQTVDDVVAWSPGYDDWFTNNLAVRLASVFEERGAWVSDDTRLEARKSESAVRSRNIDSPRQSSDCPSNRRRGDFNYYSGSDR